MVDNINNDMKLEKDFFEQNKTKGRFIVICGKTESGKSWLATNYIAISYLYTLYDEYHFILPEYETDANEETYKFIQGHQNTTVYNAYSPDITNHVKEESKTKKVLYVLDDATNYLFENKNKPELLKLSTTCRHGKGITIIVITHALKNILVPAVRAMIHFIFLGTFTNVNMIQKQLWEEHVSIMIKKDDFMQQYREFIINGTNNFLFLNAKCNYSFHVNDWALSTFDRKKSIGRDGVKIKYIIIDKRDKLKKRIQDKNEMRKMEHQLLWKPEKDEENSKQIHINFTRKNKK